MHKYFLYLSLLLFPFTTFSQTITIIDNTTRQPVPGVAVFTPDFTKSSTSNAKGQADISLFSKNDSIILKHIAYLTIKTTYAQISKNNFIVELKEAAIIMNAAGVVANRWEEKNEDIPFRVEKISMHEVKFQNPQTSADLLESGGFAYVQKSQMAGGSPMLRGFATNRVMLVVDGVRMNNAIFRSGNIQNVISIDANALDETEILFGPGAVMYGSDAIGGVMDFHTLKPILSDTNKLFIRGSAFGRFSSANLEKTGHVDFNIGMKKWAFVTSFTYGDYEDLHTGKNGNSYFLRPTFQERINGKDSILVNPDPGLQIHSAFSQVNFIQKIHFRQNKYSGWEYSFQYAKSSDAPRYDRLVADENEDGILDYAQWYYGPQKWIMNRLGYTNSNKNKLYDRLRVITAMQNFEESRHDRRTDNLRLRNQTESVLALSLNIDLDKKINEKITLYYGAESIYNKVNSIANRMDIETGEVFSTNTRYPDNSTWESYAAYSNLKYRINPRWVMNAGFRYSYFSIMADFDTTQFPFPFTHSENKYGSLNGGTGIVFNANEKWNIYINASTGFRSPNIDDIGKVFESEAGSVVVPNIGLKPEYAYNAEIGTSAIARNFLKTEITVYYTFLDNALARRNFAYNGNDSILYDGEMSRVQAIQNISQAYVYGIQAAFEIYFGVGISLRSVLNYQKGEEQSGDSLVYYPLSHAAPLFGNTHLTFVAKKIKLDFYSNYNGKMNFEDLSYNNRNDDASFAKDANEKPFVPSWYTLNFKIGYFINKYLSLTAGVENITDQLYRPFASGISSPGRNLIISLRGNF